jgi:hypothetical protein
VLCIGLLDAFVETFAETIASSHPAITSVTAAMAVSTVSGRARIGLLRTSGKRSCGAGRIAVCPGITLRFQFDKRVLTRVMCTIHQRLRRVMNRGFTCDFQCTRAVWHN